MTQINTLLSNEVPADVARFVSSKAKAIEYSMRYPGADVNEIRKNTGCATSNAYHYRKLAEKLVNNGITPEQWARATYKRLSDDLLAPTERKKMEALFLAREKSIAVRAERAKERAERKRKLAIRNTRRAVEDAKYVSRINRLLDPPNAALPNVPPAPEPQRDVFPETTRAGVYPWENYESMMGTEAYAGFLRGVVMTAITSRDTSMLAEAEAAIKKLRFIS